MKTKSRSSLRKTRRSGGFLQIDLMVGLTILSIAIVPLGLSFAREQQVLKQEYFRSVANEIADGEMEILVAGGWKNYPEGSETYPVQSRAVGVLPPGHFQLTRSGNHLRLEWQAQEHSRPGHGLGLILREADLK